MVVFCTQTEVFLTLLCLTFVVETAAQYDNYSLTRFPAEELMPLTSAYGLALEHYAEERWPEAIRYLELSLRLRRLLRDSVRYCTLHCAGTKAQDAGSCPGDRELCGRWLLLMQASCLRRCREHFPALQLPQPSTQILEDFSRRSPYKYLHHAHSRMNDLQRAVPCAFTFLQRNPKDQEMLQLMEEYKSQYDLSGYLVDHEEQPYEASFLKGVKLISSGDYGSSAAHMEEALKLYLQEFDLCQAECEGVTQLPPGGDFFTVVADVYVDILRCQLKCEDHLTPSVGGYFVEKFLATMYHYLQYAYYKMNDGRSAVPCAYSYFLFEPEDEVMQQNLLYYKSYGEQWGLQEEHLLARTEAVRHYNQTEGQRKMLEIAQRLLEIDSEDFLGPEEAAVLASESPDVEFEGMGDYEESIFASWRQPKGKGDAGEPNT